MEPNVVGKREPGRPSLGRLIFLCATCAAFVYSIYAVALMLSPEPEPPNYNQTQHTDPPSPPDKPETAELVGVWVPDEKTTARLKRLSNLYAEGSAVPRLSLESSSFELFDVPYFTKEGRPQVSLASWRGSWSLYRQQNTWALYLPHQTAETRGLLYGQRPHYQLMLMVGDPASNEPLWFVKR